MFRHIPTLTLRGLSLFLLMIQSASYAEGRTGNFVPGEVIVHWNTTEDSRPGQTAVNPARHVLSRTRALEKRASLNLAGQRLRHIRALSKRASLVQLDARTHQETRARLNLEAAEDRLPFGFTCAEDQDCAGGVCRSVPGLTDQVCTRECSQQSPCPRHATCNAEGTCSPDVLNWVFPDAVPPNVIYGTGCAVTGLQRPHAAGTGALVLLIGVLLALLGTIRRATVAYPGGRRSNSRRSAGKRRGRPLPPVQACTVWPSASSAGPSLPSTRITS